MHLLLVKDRDMRGVYVATLRLSFTRTARNDPARTQHMPVWSRWTVPWTRTRLGRRVCGCVGAWERRGERGGLVVEEDATEYVYTPKK